MTAEDSVSAGGSGVIGSRLTQTITIIEDRGRNFVDYNLTSGSNAFAFCRPASHLHEDKRGQMESHLVSAVAQQARQDLNIEFFAVRKL